MDKIVEALSKLLPEKQVKEVASAVNEMLEEAKAELEQEYNDKLEEAYADLSGELKEAEQTAEHGYQEAWSIITDLRNRLETQRVEFDQALEEGYAEAYQMLQAERGKNENLELEVYEEYDNRFKEMKAYIVEKVDEFLQFKGQEIYEQARRDILSDPRMAEHKVALDRVVEAVTGYLTDDDAYHATNSRLEEALRMAEQLKGQQKILEARNIRLSTENNKLNEQVRAAEQILVEAKANDKQERVKKAKNVQGRGQMFTEGEQVIPEYQGNVNNDHSDDHDNSLMETFDPTSLRQMQVLSGLVSEDDK